MRKIKFRVWHKKEKRWLEPWLEEDPMMSLKDFGDGCEIYLYERDSGDWSNKNCRMDDIDIQQYTGLKDKNNEEIYEGDLVIGHGLPVGDIKGTIEFISGQWQIATEFCGCSLCPIGRPAHPIEIVGNIHEGIFDECS